MCVISLFRYLPTPWQDLSFDYHRSSLSNREIYLTRICRYSVSTSIISRSQYLTIAVALSLAFKRSVLVKRKPLRRIIRRPISDHVTLFYRNNPSSRHWCFTVVQSVTGFGSEASNGRATTKQEATLRRRRHCNGSTTAPLIIYWSLNVPHVFLGQYTNLDGSRSSTI